MSSTHPSAPGARPAARPRALLALTWLVATALAAGVAWWAVTAVGGERRGDGGELLSQDRVEQLVAVQGPDGPGVGAAPTTEAGGGAVTAAPTPAPGDPAGTTAPPAEAVPPGDGAAPVAPDPGTGAPVQVARTWDVAGGRVGAACAGDTIALLYATPADGWTVEVDHAGPRELEVEFARGDADTRLRAQCVGGTPGMTVDEGSGASGDGVGGDGDDDGGRDDDGSRDGDDAGDDD